jgi:hypothetical protein
VPASSRLLFVSVSVSVALCDVPLDRRRDGLVAAAIALFDQPMIPMTARSGTRSRELDRGRRVPGIVEPASRMPARGSAVSFV